VSRSAAVVMEVPESLDVAAPPLAVLDSSVTVEKRRRTSQEKW